MNEPFRQLQQALGTRFREQALFELALTHRSFANQDRSNGTQDNERLEFLGDAVLKLMVSTYLFQKYPRMNEGDLTKLRAQLVSDKFLAQLAIKYGIGDMLKLSFSEQKTQGNQKISNLANAVEAILGAHFIECGYPETQAFFIPILEQFLQEVDAIETDNDRKSALQEWLQRHKGQLPVYTVLKEEGPDHNKTFYVEVLAVIHGQTKIKTGTGRTKKEAEQSAAQAMMEEVG